VLPPSKREYQIRGLNLIRLLTQNRIADFHTTLESLPLSADQIAESPYISHPVNLERWLMEGSYSKVWNAREEAPTEEYKIFVDSLVGTIRFAQTTLSIHRATDSFSCRNEIASCEETAYNSLPLKDAATLLFFKNQTELLSFAREVRLVSTSWKSCADGSAAWVADRLDGRYDSFHEKRGREDRDTEGKVDIAKSRLRPRA
jgi:26S proteasome regulatory subunit N12